MGMERERNEKPKRTIQRKAPKGRGLLSGSVVRRLRSVTHVRKPMHGRSMRILYHSIPHLHSCGRASVDQPSLSLSSHVQRTRACGGPCMGIMGLRTPSFWGDCVGSPTGTRSRAGAGTRGQQGRSFQTIPAWPGHIHASPSYAGPGDSTHWWREARERRISNCE